MKKLILLIFLVSCTKERIIEREKIIIKPQSSLTNEENNALILKKRKEIGLLSYSEWLPFFPNYVPKVGEVLYNNSGMNEALILEINSNVATTFEGVRDSSRLFYRRMSITQFGEFAAFPCDNDGRKNDSADVYLYHKY